jgi:quinol-cytochrome oxidoreductase complex cytochrome b subunit
MMLGGEVYNERTLSRFFMVHAAILPTLMTLLIFIHLAIIRLQGISPLKFEDAPEGGSDHFNFFPDHVMTELMIGLILMILLSTLATVLPAALGPKADPFITPEIIKPEWFFYPVFRWLKLFSGTVAVLSAGFIVFVMFLWPFIDRWLQKTRFPEASVWIGMGATVVIMGLTVWEAVVEH